MKLSDFTGVLQKHTLPLMRSYKAEDNCTVFEFNTAGKDIMWKPGQHGIFTLPEKDVTGNKWRAFSVSSIPSEGMLQIATKISSEPSSFKVALRSLQPGENIQIRGPFGWLYLRDHNSPVVMIAGGVGITPFRALFKELEQVNHRDVTLIYSSRDTYLFKSELDKIAGKDPRINIVYAHTSEEVDTALSKTLDKASPDTDYFIYQKATAIFLSTYKLINSKPRRKNIAQWTPYNRGVHFHSPQINNLKEINTLHFNQRGFHHKSISEFIITPLIEFLVMVAPLPKN